MEDVTGTTSYEYDEAGRICLVKNYEELYDFLDYKQSYYIIWDEKSLPCLKCKLNKVISSIDDVTAVSFYTWIISEDFKVVIELYHNGDITVGYVD